MWRLLGCTACFLVLGVSSLVTKDCPPSSKGPGFLWLIRRSPPSYFFGTIHVPYTRVPTPPGVSAALRASGKVYFELDLTDPRTLAGLASCQLLPGGQTLSDVLPEELVALLRQRLGDAAGDWEHKRPVWVLLMLQSPLHAGPAVPVMDLHLAHEAARLRKPTGALESVQEQCVPLNGLDIAQVVSVLNDTLTSAGGGGDEEGDEENELVKRYNCGRLGPTLVSSLDGHFRSELVLRRNRRLAARVMDLLDRYPTQSFFFAFGAGHFLGNDSVLELVRAAGLDVRHLSDHRPRGSRRRVSRRTARSRRVESPAVTRNVGMMSGALSPLVHSAPLLLAVVLGGVT